MKKLINLLILSIQFNHKTSLYVIRTAVSKNNPFENGVCQRTVKQMENIARKSPAGDIDSLISLVALGDSTMSVNTTGEHKAGDNVLDSEGKKILIPINERAGRNVDAEGHLTYAKDGLNFDQLSYEVKLGATAIRENLIASKLVKAMSTPVVAKTESTEGAEGADAKVDVTIGAEA